MKQPNGYGSITKMTGKRRHPWRVRVTTGWELDEEGKRHKQIMKTLGYCASRKEAIQMLAEYNKNPYDLAHKDITFAEVYDIWSVEHFKRHPSTRVPTTSMYKYCVSLYNMKMKDIKLSHLQAIMNAVEGKSRATQTVIKTIFNNVFGYCMKNDIIQKDYSQYVQKTFTTKKSVHDKFFTQDQIRAVMDSQGFTHRGSNYSDAVLILLYTGMRINELLTLKCCDIDLEKRIINLHGTKTEAAERIIPIHQDIVPIISARMGGEYLIMKNDKPVPYMTFYVYWAEYMKHLNIPHTPHATRHTFISAMDACGITGVVMKRIAGHANKSVTEHYTHKSIEQLIEAIDMLNLLK
jgi:integrase